MCLYAYVFFYVNIDDGIWNRNVADVVVVLS
jgi:hypothetical protein